MPVLERHIIFLVILPKVIKIDDMRMVTHVLDLQLVAQLFFHRVVHNGKFEYLFHGKDETCIGGAKIDAGKPAHS